MLINNRLTIFFMTALLAPLALAQRQVSDLNQSWKFIKADVPGAEQPAFDDSKWASVDLPHTWNADDATGGTHIYYRGPGWYRIHVMMDERTLVRREYYLWLGAAGSAAEVFVNGTSAGTHKGAFAAFCFDVTRLLHGGDNVIAVRVTNEFDKTISPISGDFNIEGGLYRGVKLLSLEKLSISPMDHASSGVQVKQTKITDDSADLEITVKLRNCNTSEDSATVACAIADAAGNSIASAKIIQPIPASSDGSVTLKIQFPHPHLWNGRDDPYLYNVSVEVADDDGSDRVSVPIGLRYFNFDPQRGFILNGKPYDLHGVNRHQEFGKKGWAITADDMRTDIDLIKEMGCTAIRCAHYQHASQFYDLCDRSGIVAWAELGLVNKIDPSPEFRDITQQQLTELITQNYNHPSICMWSMFNELWFKENKDYDLQFAKDLNAMAHELDATRPTTAASNLPVDHPGNWITDIVGFNIYSGWYSGKASDWPMQLDNHHAAAPADHAIAISEYGAGASVLQHQADLLQPTPKGHWHPEEWQSYVHEQAWTAMSQRPFLWGKFIWNFSNFSAAPRDEGDTIGTNDKGLVTADRKIKKDAFYFYKASWSSEPFVYITDRRFTPRPQQIVNLKIYSNCDRVDLSVNDQSLGAKTSDNHIYRWNDVKLNLGENRIRAVGIKDGKDFTDDSKIVYNPSATTQP
jgi:beta-galactosidase